MDHGASIPSNACNFLFCHQELVDGSKYICDDATFRVTFVKYLQQGEWREQISKFIPKDIRLIISLDQLGREKVSLMNEYAIPRDRLGAVYGAKCTSLPGIKRANSDLATLSSKLSNEKSECDQSQTLEPIAGFSLAHTVSILFSVLYPMYAASVDAEDLQSDRGRLTPISIEAAGAAARTSAAPAPPAYALRSSEAMLQSVRTIPEDVFERELKKPTFSTSVLEAFHVHAMAITVVDAARDGFPLVYANKAFEALSGWSLPALLRNSKSLLVLCGAESEATQLALLHEAQARGQSAKLGVSCYHRRRPKQPFLNMIALRSCGRYSIAVHFPATQEADLAQLPMVDDLLALLALTLWHCSQDAAVVPETPKRDRLDSAAALLSLVQSRSVDSGDTMPRMLLRVGQDGAVSRYWGEAHPRAGKGKEMDENEEVPLYWRGGGSEDEIVDDAEAAAACDGKGESYSFGEGSSTTVNMDVSRELSASRLLLVA